MAANIQLEELKKMIENSVKAIDRKGLLQNLETFSDNYKNDIGKEELDNLQTLLAQLRQTNKHTATSYEYLLFFFVLFILLGIFGEINISNLLSMFFLLYVIVKLIDFSS